MTPSDRYSMSRRAALKITALGVGSFALHQAIVKTTPASANDRVSLEITPGAISEYLSKTSATGLTDTDGIQNEYAQAVAIFPLIKPDGWAFPESLNLDSFPPNGDIQRGLGVSTAYLCWQSAVTQHAYEFARTGDFQNSNYWLEVLAAAYSTPVRRAVIDDPTSTFLADPSSRTAIVTSPWARAKTGDFEALLRYTIYP